MRYPESDRLLLDCSGQVRMEYKDKNEMLERNAGDGDWDKEEERGCTSV